MKRTHAHWKCRNKFVPLGEKTLVMGILNTPRPTPFQMEENTIHMTLHAPKQTP